MMVVLCGTTGVLAAEKQAEKPAVQKSASPKPADKKPGAKAAPAAKPAVQAEAVPAPKETVPKESAPKVAADEAGDGDEGGDGGKADPKGSAAGLPIPRFVSLRTNPINLRTGPGVRYPVDWVYVRRHLPVEVIGEFDTWRQIRDPDGTEGWVHQSMISGKRAAIVTKEPRPLKRTGEETAETVATLEQGVIVNLQRCPAESAYCRVEVNGMQGWLKRDQFWGVYPNETLQ
jgi:SH3-like domain-containing protein